MQIAAPLALVAALAAQPLADASPREKAGHGTTIISQERGQEISVRRNDEPMIRGSGRIVASDRAVRNFSRIVSKTAADMDVRIGPQYSVEVSTDDNLVDRLTTRLVDGTLEIDFAGSMRTRTMPRVRVTLPRLDHIDTQGSGEVRITGLDGGGLDLASHGASDFFVEGRAERLAANIYGSGNIDLTRVRTPDLSIAIYGSASVRAFASGRLDAAIHGSGTIEYGGTPEHVSRAIHGSGRIAPIRL